MNNRTQQRFDKSIRDAAKATGHTETNDRAQKDQWRAMERAMRLPETMPAVAVPSSELDALIAELVAKDALKAE